MSAGAHHQVQAEHWSRAQPAHFAWKTRNPVLRESERALVQDVDGEGAVLEVGCGEGANLAHLQGRGARFAVDRFREKVRFAQGAVPGLRAVVADAAALPFAAERFDAVLIRDLLHHVYDRDRVLAEAWRVLRPGGVLHVVEVNRGNALFLVQALLIRAERGILRSSPRRLRAELRRLPAACEVAVEMAQPFPLARLLLHPELGRPALAERSLVRGGLALLAACGSRNLPRASWGYMRGRARKLHS